MKFSNRETSGSASIAKRRSPSITCALRWKSMCWALRSPMEGASDLGYPGGVMTGYDVVDFQDDPTGDGLASRPAAVETLGA